MLGRTVFWTRIRSLSSVVKDSVPPPGPPPINLPVVKVQIVEEISAPDPVGDKVYLHQDVAPEELLEDVKTHTGQIWDKNDYRMVRFAKFPKLVNQRRAIDLIDDIAPMGVTGSRTFCDGGGGPLGHPKVFINVDQPGNHACGYCGLRFYKNEHHH